MPDVITSVYQLVLPEVGGSDDTWGTKLNQNLAKAETLLVGAYTGGGPAALGRLKDANLSKTWLEPNLNIDNAASKSIILRDAAGLAQAAFGFDGTNYYAQRYAPDGIAVVGRIRITPDGLIEANVGTFSGPGAFQQPWPGVITDTGGFIIKNDAFSKYMFQNTAGTKEFGSAYSTGSGDVGIRRRNSADDGTVASVQVNLNGTITTVGTFSGLAVTPDTVSAAGDLSKHLNLHGGNYGLNVRSGVLGVLSNGNIEFRSDGGPLLMGIMSSDGAGSSVANAETLLTRAKGDARYARTTSEVLALIAGASVGAVGTYAMCKQTGSSSSTQGTTRSGSNLVYSNAWGENTGGSLSGTWQCMGRTDTTSNAVDAVSLWLRVA